MMTIMMIMMMMMMMMMMTTMTMTMMMMMTMTMMTVQVIDGNKSKSIFTTCSWCFEWRVCAATERRARHRTPPPSRP